MGWKKIRIRDTASAQVRNLVESLLRLDPEERLGSGDVTRHGAYLSIKRHPFFAGLDFETLHQTVPPFTLEACDSPAGTEKQCCGSGIRCLFDPWIRDR